MKRAPTEVLVETAYITMTMEGGIRMPRPPAVAMTPTPKRVGKPCLTMAGNRMEPMATTVAGRGPGDGGEQGAGHDRRQTQSPPW